MSFCAPTTLRLLPRAWRGVFPESPFAHSPTSPFPVCQGPPLQVAGLVPLEEAESSIRTEMNISPLASLPRPESPGLWDRGRGKIEMDLPPKRMAGEGGDFPLASSNYGLHQEIHF